MTSFYVCCLIYTGLPGEVQIFRFINLDVEMVGIKPKDAVPSAAVKFFGAGAAGCIADLITFPLDTAKVRLQVRSRRHSLTSDCAPNVFL